MTSDSMKDIPNPFDPESLRLSQDFGASVGVRKLLTTIPVRKPNRQEFVRVHKSEDYRLQTAILELKEEREIYLVAPSLLAELPGEVTLVELFTSVTRQNVLFLWPVKIPGLDGRVMAWHSSALDAAQKAQDRWIRVAANMSLGAYEIFEATGDIPEPEWPKLEFKEILKIAFRDHFINSPDHPVIGRLRGES